MGSHKTNNCSDRQQISHAILPNESNSTSTVERIRLCVAIQLQKSTHRWLSQHCSWFSLPKVTQSHGEDTSQKIGTVIKQHLSKWPHLPRDVKINSHKQTKKLSQKNKPSNEKNNLDNMWSNGCQMRSHPRRKPVWKILQRSTDTLRHNRWMASKQMREYE